MLKVIPVTLQAANDFVAEFHRHSRPVVGAKFAIGVIDQASMLRGVGIVGRPTSPKIAQDLPCEITRVCTDGAHNACSMLYAACRKAARAMGHEPVYTYSLPNEGGASLRAAGFRLDKENAGGPASAWHNRPGRTAVPVGDDLVGGKWRWVG